MLYALGMMIVGIDEVGRGPLAGPVSVGVLMFPKNAHPTLACIFGETRDSKKLGKKRREEWFLKIKKLQKEGVISYVVVSKSADFIDKKGISFAIRACIALALKKLKVEEKAEVLLDGSLRAPAHFKNQKTIIKGDEKELPIALASIVAKVTRDRKMVKLSQKYPGYFWDINKGYGTKVHRETIKKLGFSPLHRRSFCKNIKG